MGTAGAVSLQASEGLVLTIPNQDLGLSPNVTKAPKVRLSRRAGLFPLTVTGFVAGHDGEVTCSVPSGLEAGHYSLWVLKSGQWVKADTLVKVFAPVVNSVTVTGNTIQSGAQVTLGGLFFSKTPAVIMHYQNSQLQSVDQSCGIPDSSSAMDVETAASQIQVQMPDLGNDNPASCVFEVQSPNGSAFVYYSNMPLPSRGQLISSALQNMIKKKDVWDYLIKSLAGTDGWKQIATYGLLSRTELWTQSYEYKYDLQLYNISYWTVDTSGNYVVASGVVIVPENITTVPLLSFQHGTMLMKSEAPTLSDGPELAFAATFAAADGFLVSMPDHLGLGQSAERTQLDLTHPYCQAVPLATAAIDMMDAVKSFLSLQFDDNLQLKDKLFLAGYSEGGYATMALHRELDTTSNDLPPVTASACMDGPYSLSKIMVDKLMANQTFPVLYFAPYLLVAMDRTYNLYSDASEYMNFPYDMTVAPLINGYFSEATVDSQMPPSRKPRDVLLPTVANQLQSYQGPIYDVLLTNDLAPAVIPFGAWKPTVPMRLIHGKRDDCVPYGNLTYAINYFNALQAPLVTDGSFDNSWVTFVYDHTPSTYHVLYCPFAMGFAWKYFHEMQP